MTGLITANALGESSGDFDYRIIAGGMEVEITGYHGAGGALTVPSTIDSLTVSSIGDSALYGHDEISSLVLPNTIETVGWSAFYHCSSLSSISMPGAISLGPDAFGECAALTSVSLGTALISIGEGAFRSCPSLTSISIPASVNSIGELAFSDCGSLTSITVASGNSDFASVNGALYDKDLTTLLRCPGGRPGTISLPDTVTSVQMEAFAGCHLLTSIVAGPVNKMYSSLDGVLYDKDKSDLVRCPGGKAGPFTVPDGVVTIRADAFAGCHLTSLGLPDSVTIIGASAFSLSTDLTSVTLPDNIVSIPDWAFYGCAGLRSIQVPAQVGSIGRYAFAGCSGLEEMRFLGDAPTCGEGWAEGHGANLTVRYYLGATGFTSPFWQGLSAIGTPPPQVPNPPTGLAAAVLSDRVLLSWNAPPGPVTDYLVHRGSGSEDLAPLAESATTSFLDDTVERGKTYRYSISARNDMGEGGLSSMLEVAVPLLSVQVTGRMVDDDGKGVAGVNVTMEGQLVRTDAEGRFQFTTASGDHMLSYFAAGIQDGNLSIVVGGSDQDLGDIAVRSTQEPDGEEDDPLATYMMLGAAAVLLVTVSLIAIHFIRKRTGHRR